MKTNHINNKKDMHHYSTILYAFYFLYAVNKFAADINISLLKLMPTYLEVSRRGGNWILKLIFI